MSVLRDDNSQYLPHEAPLPFAKSDSTDTIVFYARASERFTVLRDRGVGGPPCHAEWDVLRGSCFPGPGGACPRPQLLPVRKRAASSLFKLCFQFLAATCAITDLPTWWLAGQLNAPR